jgi:hypothetical protein
MEAIRSSETSDHTRSTQYHIPEDGILYKTSIVQMSAMMVKPKQLRPKTSRISASEEKNSSNGPQSINGISAKGPDISGYTEEGISIDQMV